MISKEEEKRIIQQMRFNSSLILRLQAMNVVHKMRLGIPPFDSADNPIRKLGTATKGGSLRD